MAVGAAVDQAVEQVQPLAEERGIALSAEVPEELQARADAKALDHVVSTSGATVGGGGGEVDGCSALSTLVPHYGQNFWCSSKSAPQLLQNTIMIQIIPGQGRV